MRVLITGGIGDVLVLESTGQFEHVSTLFWASRAQPLVQPILEQLYSDITHETVYDKFDNDFRCFVTGNEAEQYLSQRIPKDVIDWSICHKFRENLPFVGSRCLAHTLAPIEKPPGRFYVIQSDTTENDPNHRATRQLDARDWEEVITFLDKHRARGIVLGGAGSEQAPAHKRLADCQGLTTVAESIELLKHSIGYLGIDSWLSVLASQLFDAKHLLVKCNNPHGNMWRRIYWKPHTEFTWLKRSFWKSESIPIDMLNDVKKVQLRLLVPRLFSGENLQPGAILELPETLAALWIKNGLATPVEQEAPVKPGIERAVRRPTRRKAVTIE